MARRCLAASRPRLVIPAVLPSCPRLLPAAPSCDAGELHDPLLLFSGNETGRRRLAGWIFSPTDFRISFQAFQAQQRFFAMSRESRLLVRCFGVSLDGFGAGPHQDLEHPLGVGGPAIMEWFFHTRVFQRMHGTAAAPSTQDNPVDERFAEDSFAGIGAWILGRNMFGPVRGPWPDETWRGWWGEEPPYHTPVFVLTHHARSPLRMAGGTTFHFVTQGIHAALEQARAAAAGGDVRLGGGVATLRQYLQARLIDELHLAVRPVLLGRGEALFAGLDLCALGYECVEHVAGERAMHVRLRRSRA